MPVSTTYAVTPCAVVAYVYEPSSGRSRWSIRSSGHGAGFCASLIRNSASGSTEATRGSAARAAARAAVVRTAKPLRTVS